MNTNNHTPHCAIIACDHGFGHVRRCLLIANKHAQSGWQVDLFAPKVAVNKLSSKIELNRNIIINNFHTNLVIEELKTGKFNNWTKFLPPFEKYDIVISDNLLEILEVRSDAIISGSFLWHYAIEGIDSSLFNYAESLLKKYKPKMFASSLFASEKLHKVTKLHPVGLFVSTLPPENRGQGNDLLVSCGMSSELEEEFKNVVNILVEEPKPPFNTVWIEPRLMPNSAPAWMKAAEFDDDMFLNLKAAICRPGVGIITDCLWGGTRIFCFYEKGNIEMKENADALMKAGVGESCLSINKLLISTIGYSIDYEKKRKHKKALKSISFDGTNQFASHIQGEQRYIQRRRNYGF